MKYDFEFKPRAVKELSRLPVIQQRRILAMEELADYEDLRLLREAKTKEKKVPGIGLDALKTQLKINPPPKKSSRQKPK